MPLSVRPKSGWERYARELGVRLHRLRTERGLTQERLAVAADISAFTYRKLEKASRILAPRPTRA